MSSRLLLEIYRRLYRAYGPQGWWPARSAFEVIVGAVLTQNTNWTNVERAIENLRSAHALDARSMLALTETELAQLIRPAGYFNVKARRLRNVVSYIAERHRGKVSRMSKRDTHSLRSELLSINGVGPETADSILLYAVGKPVFVIDAYTRRVMSRHGVPNEGASYGEFQGLFMQGLQGALPGDKGSTVELYNEYHALLVNVAKLCCRPRNPRCEGCPLEGL